MSDTAATDLIHATIDGQAVAVPKGTTVYAAAKALGIDLPIFCYHDRMPPFGACRMCLVEVEKMPKPQTSCTLVITEGMVIKTNSHTAIESRKDILEYLLINHPLDCPICDRGGECPLQDQTYEHGPGKSRFFEEKRHFIKPLPLGSVLMLDRERCIACARCTRFCDLVSGDHALQFIDRGYRTEVGTPESAPVVSKFIGNTIQICPVGALTSQVYRFRARPWDNDTTASCCTLCPVGCSLNLDARDGEIMRTRSLENREVNDVWLCDKGWFGYEFASHPQRLKTPLLRQGDSFIAISWEQALAHLSERLLHAKPHGRLAAWGGNHLTFEESFLLQRLMRRGLGTHHLDHRIGMAILSLEEEGLSPGMQLNLADCEGLSYAVILGLDVTEEYPLLWLRLRQAINRGAKVSFFGHYAPEISPYLSSCILHPPGQELEILKRELPRGQLPFPKDSNGALFIGRQYLAHPHRKAILSYLAKLQEEHPLLSINIMEGRSNSQGARLAGMRPDMGPLGEKLPAHGLNVIELLLKASNEAWDCLYVVGANPAKKYPSELWRRARSNIAFLAVQDLFLNETAAQADLVLPTLSFLEKEGTFINIAGTIQKLHPGKNLPEGLLADEAIFRALAQKIGFADFEPIPLAVKVQHTSLEDDDAKALPMLEGRLAATFVHCLFDQGVRMRHNPHLYELAPKATVRIHPAEGKKRGINDGDHARLISEENSITAPVHLDPKIAMQTIVIPLGCEAVAAHELALNLLNGLALTVERAI